MDPFAQFPNELLQEVFKHVASLPGKFKLAAVNQKFRGAIMKMLGKPMDLKLTYEEKTINDVQVPHDKWHMAIEVLAECTDFEEIEIHAAAAGKISFDGWPPFLLDDIFDILIMTDSLSQATAFESEIGSGAMIECLLKGCPKMAEVWLKSAVSRMPHPTAFNVDLRSALGGKAITYLRLKLKEYPLPELSAFFKSLVPNTLRQCFLNIDYPLDLVEITKELSGSAWAALEELDMSITESSGAQLELLSLVTQLPRLRKCSITFEAFGKHDTTITLGQFAGAVISMFNCRTEPDQLALNLFDSRLGNVLGIVFGCSIVHLVRRVRQKHPELEFEHGEHLGPIELTLANLKFTCCDDVTSCHNGCFECRSFFPNVIRVLYYQATSQRNGHLENHQLDRCRVGRVVEEIISKGLQVKALSAEINEAQDQATITFETTEGQQFYITVACGRCFDNSCIKCFVV